ncbi:hypothetical protein BDN72DRAFT_818421 [Pluteus cervinus]|uniref:Uncharacterized protein n=1 Tax=Pluteus cervinus TaxID=181527 RepID=A0ACD3AYK4_9AGAR|nr:hypothetical protein BDN72DRAFT_818421 [Pluteus cervinus]
MPNEDVEEEPDVPSCHVPDCTLPIDVVIKTSDAKYFGTHLQNLESYGEGFPPASLGKRKRVNYMDIEEDSDVLSLMLDFMHKQPQPDLQQLQIKVLVRLAEAAEKYLIYSAISICRVMIGNRIPEAPLEILGYAIKHNYHNIANKAAPLSLESSWNDARRELGASGLILWAEYREYFHSLFRGRLYPVQFHPPFQYAPRLCSEYDIQVNVLNRLFKSPGTVLSEGWKDQQMASVDLEHDMEPCSDCEEGLRLWLQNLVDAAELFPKFSTLL